VYLHACGIVHRDVKPANVLLTRHGQVKLIDFGIAHVSAARRLTISGLSRSLGTPDYMAPEQIRGRTGDARTDVYALGTVLYQMLTGRLPFPDDAPDALLGGKRDQDPAPPSTYAPGLDPALEAIVLRAISLDPRDRHATALDLLEDLRDPASAAARAPAPRSPGAPRRASSRRLLAAFAAVAAALTLLGWLAWLSHRRMLETAAETTSRRAPSVVAHDAARAGARPDLRE
jgi:serine/threonine protein kinase